MKEEMLLEQVEKEATDLYIRHGVYGGKTTRVAKGVVQTIKYFPYGEVKKRLLNRHAQEEKDKHSQK